MTYGDYSELIGRAQKGDTEAMAQLYSASYNKVYFYAFKMFGNTDDACDIVQDVFVIVFTKIKDLREPAAYMSWISQITVNACKQKIRKDKKVMIQEEADELIDNIADDDISVEDIVADRDMRNFMMQIIDILPEEQKRSVLLYYYERLTIAQIAEIEGVSDSSIKSRLFYAREKMKKAIRFQEKKSGVKMFAFGAPALAVVLAENAAEFALPVPVAREIFFAVMAVIGIRNTDHRPVMSVIGSSGENDSGSLLGKIKDGVVIAVHPKQIIALAIIVVAVFAVSVVFFSNRGTATTGGTESANETDSYFYSTDALVTSVPLTDLHNGNVMIKKSDLNKSISDNAVYYDNQFYFHKEKLGPLNTYVRSSDGAGAFNRNQAVKFEDEITLLNFSNSENFIVFYDKNYNPLGYAGFYNNNGNDPPKYLKVASGYRINRDKLKKQIRSDVKEAVNGAVKLNEDDFYYFYDKDREMYALGFRKNKLPESVDPNKIQYITNVLCDNIDDENMNYFYGSIAQYWQSEGKFIGQENYDSQINRVCSYQNGESYDNGSRYNLISVVSNNKIIAVAYLDDNKIKHPNGMPE